MIYVDKLRRFGTWGRNWKKSCHMTADSIPELKDFAVKIGLRMAWYQPTSYPHFDLTNSKRKQALEIGAIELDDREFIGKAKKLKETI